MVEITEFLVSDKTDANGFRIDWASIKAGANKWIGKPGVLACTGGSCGHLKEKTGEDQRKASELHKVTEIVDVALDEKTHSAFAKHHIISEEFHRMYCDGLVTGVSQDIILDENPKTHPIHVTKDMGWEPINLTFLVKREPAYGDEARVKVDPCACNKVNLHETMIQSMDENPEKKEETEEKHVMSMEEEVHELYSMVKSMVESKEEKKEETSVQSEVGQNNYRFSWPEAHAEKPKHVEDLKLV